MVFNQVLYLAVKRIEDDEVGCDKCTFASVASRQVLRGDDRNDLALLASHQQHLAVVVGKVGGVDDLGDERPQFERLVGGLVVEYQVETGNEAGLLDEEQSADEFFAN